MSEYMTGKEAQEYLRVGRTTLWLMVRRGWLAAYRGGQGGPTSPLLYRRADVEALMGARRVDPRARIGHTD